MNRYKILSRCKYKEYGVLTHYFEIVDTDSDMRYELFYSNGEIDCPNVSADEYIEISEFILRSGLV